jgi:hypothetical protein
VNHYQEIVFEDLQTKNLTKRPKAKQDKETGQYLPNGAAAKAGLNKSILDAGWATFTEMTCVKAAWAGRTVVFVNPYKTSQICSGCGAEGKKTFQTGGTLANVAPPWIGTRIQRNSSRAWDENSFRSGRGQRGQLRRSPRSETGGTFTLLYWTGSGTHPVERGRLAAGP